MKVIINQDNNQPGVFIPLDEWDDVIGSVKHNTTLLGLLSRQPGKSVFSMTGDEINNLVQPVAAKLVADAHKGGLYTSHPGPKNQLDNQFLHRYEDGTIQLVEIDITNGAEKVLKTYR